MTRLERWERAQAMGLNPPTEVSSDESYGRDCDSNKWNTGQGYLDHEAG